MKAKFIAAVLSLSVITLSAHAVIAKENSNLKKPPVVLHKIDLNTADLSMLTGSVKGIGKKRAEAIIAYRKSHHGFKSLEELAEVKGLGQHFVTANRDKLNQVFVVNRIE
ncbi:MULTISPECIES: ComEA family DNA-binding protein [Legionella]|uniref:Helix-hairpin-helix domain-containing protein n=1 Tax=Legionella resiliens TaxID=2905958 RepID=A0ABS8X3V3_9GAMM|nr:MULTISPECIES: helix-hairpin-helix domain-containing protein [unclassified Legionella]MCE0724286.1 helix-hairpin-helix domain-containing protein [Legionella sp. 9fVS26]MCE3533438.1 helix-hairpin-helix domain-containing protein [Legionella sp. 8cVS16]QLZ69623.1 competence protein ComEA [Legionella sp. PC1000]